MPTWLYVFIRTDLPVTQQAVQAAHSVFEAAKNYIGEHPSFVFLAVENGKKLEQVFKDYQGYPFYETYADWGLTAFAVGPVTAEERYKFKDFPLWRAK